MKFDDALRATAGDVMERVFVNPTGDLLSILRRCLVSFRADPLDVTLFISNYIQKILREKLEDPSVDVRTTQIGDSIKPYLGVAIDLPSLASHLIDAANVILGSLDNVKETKLKLCKEILVAAHDVLTNAGTLEGITRLMSACKVMVVSRIAPIAVKGQLAFLEAILQKSRFCLKVLEVWKF